MKKLITLCFIAIIVAFFIFQKKQTLASFEEKEIHHLFVITHAHTLLGFDLVDPGQAPLNIRDRVLRGYRIIMNTPFYAPKYVHDQLSCTNCHFAEGDTLGGKNNGISLVGVTSKYPAYSERDGKIISLADRINNCFERSMSGLPLPKNSPDMEAIIIYLEWISKEVKHIKHMPWLGLTFLKSQHRADPRAGEKVYEQHCALCHKREGNGGGVLLQIEGKTVPPLWGPESFNDGAGMSRLSMLAAFTYWNMPYQQPFLTEEQALDVAAFILEQPRNHFEVK